MRLVESRPGRPVLIRITPLIDVVFILLIFFMLTSRLTPLGAVEVSSTTPGGGGSDKNLPSLHLLAPEGLRWNGQDASQSQVLARLDQLRPDIVVVSADPATPLNQFTRWHGLLAERGITGQWRKNGKAAASADDSPPAGDNP